MNQKFFTISLALLVAAGGATAQQRKQKSGGRKKTEKTEKTGRAAGKKKAAARQQPARSRAAAPSRDSIKGATIEVYQNYRPELKPAPKPAFNPSLPPADTARPAFRYEVPQQTLYYTYRSMPLRPLALGKDTVTPAFPSYIKLGGGNLSTLYLDAGIASLRGDNWESALHLHHLSQKGERKNQETATTGLEAEGSLRTADHTFRAGLDILRRKLGYYGFNPDLAPGLNPDLEQVFTGARLSVGARNEQPNNWGIDYAPSASAAVFGDKYNTTERSFGFDVPVTKQFDSSLTAGIGLSGRFAQFKNDNKQVGNNILQVKPFLSFHQGSFQGHFGLYPTWGKNNNTYLLPDIRVALRIPQTAFEFSAGWEALLHQNTYEQLSLKNPFVSNEYSIRQTRTDEVFASIATNIGTHLTVNGKVSWWQYNSLPMFLNSAASREFEVVFDPKVQALGFQAGARYQVANTFALGVSGTWYNFYEKTNSRVWHEPSVRLNADLLVRPIPELSITAYASVLDQIYALDEQGNEVKLKGILDIGGGAEYQLIPMLSVFVSVHNLLNNKYERWRGYEAYGFNIFGGLRFKF